MYFISYPHRWYHWAVHTSRLYRYALTIIMTVVLSGLLYHLHWYSTHIIQQEQNAISALLVKQRHFNTIKSSDGQTFEVLNKLRQEVNELRQSISSDNDLAHIISAIQESGLSLTMLDHAAGACSSSDAVASEIRCTMQGSMQQLFAFFNKLNAQKNIITCSQIMLKKSGPLWDATMHLNAKVPCALFNTTK